MAVVTVLHHLDQGFLGHAGPPLRAAGLEIDERLLDNGDALPEPGAFGGLLVLGGLQSAVRADEDPLLRAEAALLREAVAAGTPVLGICLGGQLLAHALGGTVRHLGRVVEWRALRKLPAAAGDPLFAGLPEPVPALHFNEDVFDPPPGAEILAGPAPSGAAVFRAGPRAWGLQYHPDVDDDIVQRWITSYGHVIPDVQAFRETSRKHADVQARASRHLFGAFARVVQAHAAGRPEPRPASA